MKAPTEIVAHRGYSTRAPENTLSSLEAAVRAGADAVEFDLHTAACGTPVVFHDATLGRTTDGSGPIGRRTFAQLGTLDAGGWFGPDFAGERIPSFAQALERLKGRIGRIYAEVKGFREPEDLERMIREARDAALLSDTVFISLNWASLDLMRGLEPRLSIGYVVDEAAEVDEAVERAKSDERAFLDFRAELLLADPGLAGRCASSGIGMGVWTVDDPAEAGVLLEMGVRRFTTNEVEALLAWRRG